MPIVESHVADVRIVPLVVLPLLRMGRKDKVRRLPAPRRRLSRRLLAWCKCRSWCDKSLLLQVDEVLDELVLAHVGELASVAEIRQRLLQVSDSLLLGALPDPPHVHLQLFADLLLDVAQKLVHPLLLRLISCSHFQIDVP